MITHLRFWLGRHCIHFGLWLWPESWAKNELHELLRIWGQHVTKTVRDQKENL